MPATAHPTTTRAAAAASDDASAAMAASSKNDDASSRGSSDDASSSSSSSEDEGDLLEELWPRETQEELKYEVWHCSLGPIERAVPYIREYMHHPTPF